VPQVGAAEAPSPRSTGRATRRSLRPMCNLYSITKGPQAIRDFTRAVRDTIGNLPPIPGRGDLTRGHLAHFFRRPHE
jgi:hypothetical protein